MHICFIVKPSHWCKKNNLNFFLLDLKYPMTLNNRSVTTQTQANAELHVCTFMESFVLRILRISNSPFCYYIDYLLYFTFLQHIIFYSYYFFLISFFLCLWAFAIFCLCRLVLTFPKISSETTVTISTKALLIDC